MELEPRPGRTQTYGQLDVAAFLRDVGLRQVRPVGSWTYFCCPFHNDRKHPSASMHSPSTKWTCHTCGCNGNAARLLAMHLGISTREAHHRILARDYFTPLDLPPKYERRTQRQSTGSREDLRIQQEQAIELLQKGTRYSRAKDALMALYGISERTAKRRLRAAKQALALDRPVLSLGRREADALPFLVMGFNSELQRFIHPVKRSGTTPRGRALPTLLKGRNITTPGKTENLAPNRLPQTWQFTWASSRKRWPNRMLAP